MYPMLEQLVVKHPELKECIPDIERTLELLKQTYRQGGKVLICGNGGSAADTEHLVSELMKGYLLARPIVQAMRTELTRRFPENGAYLADHLQGALPTLSLVSQTSLITAYANDVAPDMIFAQQVYGYGVRGDAVIGISTSGNSKNVLHALQVGQACGLGTIGMTGKSGGAMRAVCDLTVRVPHEVTAEIQERQLAIYHAVCAILEREFFAGA
jgi:D-sedoheptulose 7-phosphate isomerase